GCIVKLDQLNTNGKTQHRTMRALLPASAPDFTLDRQLGSDGLFRVDSPLTLAADSAIQQLSTLAGYRFAEPDLIVHADATPNDSSFTQLWGMNNTGQTGGVAGTDIRATQAWHIATGSSSNVV